MSRLADYTFRFKLRRSKRTALDVEEPRLEWPVPGEPTVLVLSSGSDEIPLHDAETLYIVSSGWPSAEAATDAAARLSPILLRTFARLRIGVDAGQRAPGGGGLARARAKKIEEGHGVRIINDVWGLMVYETEPRPLFTSSSGSITAVSPRRHFDRILSSALHGVESLSAREEIALDLFNASFFQKSADSRLLMLMMAIEAMLDPQPRSEAAVEHVERLIDLTSTADSLEQSERESIHGILRYMRRESIRQTGFKLVSQLGDRLYTDRSPVQFFDYCYGLRSSLVHGACPLPGRDEIGHAAANLEVMVSDLLAGSLRDVDPNEAASG